MSAKITCPQVKVKFIGGAQEQYDSFKDLATSALDMYSPNWKNYDHPKSYMFPPVYSYRRPEVSDQMIEDLKKETQEQEGQNARSKGNSSGSTSQKLDSLPKPRKFNFFDDFRVGDKAEHIVYDALEAVSHLESISPLIIINSLDLNRIKFLPSKIFQNQDQLGGEYDFVIIGPKVGIVVIEVKNSNKSIAGSQLHSFEKMIAFFKKEYPAVQLPEEHLVRKLLIFVSSTKYSQKKEPINKQKNPEVNDQSAKDMGPKPQEQEVSSDKSVRNSRCLTTQKPDSNKVKQDVAMGEITIWDQDDIKNRANHISKPGFYTKFFNFFHETGYKLTKDVYESFAPIFIGMASFITSKSSSSFVELTLDLLKVSEAAVLTVDSCRLECHNPKTVSPMTKLETVGYFNLVILRTPDQQRALAEPTPNRQFIIGAPGTGKTVVLQLKALKMIDEGKKVLILTAPSYMKKFKNFIEFNRPCSKMDVDSWSKNMKFSNIFLLGHSLTKALETLNAVKVDPIFFIKNLVKTVQFEIDVRFDNFDGVFIDDACDQVDDTSEHMEDTSNPFWRFGNLCAAVMYMAVFEMSHPSKTLWIAMDLVLPPLGNGWNLKNMQARLMQANVMNQLLSNSTNQIPGYPFATVVLNQIMRHSENIFKSIYAPDVLSQLKLRPIMGHKIVGKKVTKLSAPSWESGYENTQIPLSPDLTSLHRDKCETLWTEVKKILDQIQNDQIPLNFVCILVGGEQWDAKILLDSIKTKCIECSIPTISTETEIEAFQRNPYYRYSYENENIEALFLDYWCNVASREWQIVIFCTITNKLTWTDGHAIQRYRAYSRAIVKLYEVSVRYRSLTGAGSRAERSKDEETLNNIGPATNRKPTLKRSNTVNSFDLDIRIPLTDVQLKNKIGRWKRHVVDDDEIWKRGCEQCFKYHLPQYCWSKMPCVICKKQDHNCYDCPKNKNKKLMKRSWKRSAIKKVNETPTPMVEQTTQDVAKSEPESEAVQSEPPDGEMKAHMFAVRDPVLIRTTRIKCNKERIFWAHGHIKRTVNPLDLTVMVSINGRKAFQVPVDYLRPRKNGRIRDHKTQQSGMDPGLLLEPGLDSESTSGLVDKEY